MFWQLFDFWRQYSARQLRAVIAAILVSLIGAGFSAHAGLASLDQIVPPAPPLPVATGYDADDHFPGALYFTAIEDGAAPAPGTTGTIMLPDAPVTDVIDGQADASIHPAQPFVMRGTATDHARALQCLTTAIYYEAATEPDDGQRAVAQVILNRARHPVFPSTVCGVIYQGSEKRGCQFSYACDGAMARVPARAAWERAKRVAEAALGGYVFAPVGLATHYHTYAVKPYWNRSLVMTGAFGAHFFHRWKGYWGTPAAFRQVYAGGEPFPGPKPRIDVAQVQFGLTPPAPGTGLAPPKPVTARTAVQTGYLDSGAPVDRYVAPPLPESTILDKWKDSGKPLR